MTLNVRTTDILCKDKVVFGLGEPIIQATKENQLFLQFYHLQHGLFNSYQPLFSSGHFNYSISVFPAYVAVINAGQKLIYRSTRRRDAQTLPSSNWSNAKKWSHPHAYKK